MATSTKRTMRQPWEELDDNLEANSVVAPADEAAAIDEALGLQMISIRLQRSLLNNLKLIAQHHKIGYQPLIRDLLNRFASSEMQHILHALVAEKKAKLEQIEREMNEQPPLEPIDEFLAREGEKKRA